MSTQANIEDLGPVDNIKDLLEELGNFMAEFEKVCKEYKKVKLERDEAIARATALEKQVSEREELISSLNENLNFESGTCDN
ncbi:hypothetical protein V6N13_013985 [Hibiscus sabdariffa]|uniref:Uncharacterized protein n=1 Tax=Hibiscus sabdariffa TaxID=183260 RepID=A0ABR2RUD0_9ROSI